MISLKQKMKNGLNTTELFCIKYHNKVFKEYYTPIFFISGGIFLIIYGTVPAIFFGKHDPSDIIAILGSIPLTLAGYFFWPTIPCRIRLFQEYIIFNQKRISRIYNPTTQLSYSNIKTMKYDEVNKIIDIITKTNLIMRIDVKGADIFDLDELIVHLEKKGINVERE